MSKQIEKRRRIVWSWTKRRANSLGLDDPFLMKQFAALTGLRCGALVVECWISMEFSLVSLAPRQSPSLFRFRSSGLESTLITFPFQGISPSPIPCLRLV